MYLSSLFKLILIHIQFCVSSNVKIIIYLVDFANPFVLIL